MIRTFFLIATLLALTITAGCGKKEEAANAKATADKATLADKSKRADKGDDSAKNKGDDKVAASEDGDKETKAEAPAPPATPKISPRARRTAPKNVAAPPADAKKTKKGIPYVVLQAGKGTVKPKGDDTVSVRFTAWDTNGKPTSTTWKVKTQAPREIRFAKAIPGWMDALSTMVEGERRLLWIPAKLAHANARNAKKGPRTVDLELFKLKIAPAPPADVKRAPKDAQKSASGLRWKVLTKGTGNKKPSANSTVTVKYAGWKTNGHCFDHTDLHDPKDTSTFNLSSVIKGWTEGLQLMVEGEKTRFWIPKKIAYDGMDGKPSGTLVFDVELVKIVTP